MKRTKMPFVSLLLPNYNNEPVIDIFFDKLITATTYPRYEIIVVDDGSNDDSLRILRKYKNIGRIKEFTLIEKDHTGIVDTLNIGLKAVRGDIVVRLDGDATIESPNWLERMLSFFLRDDRIGCLVGKIIFDSGKIHSLGRNVVSPEGLYDIGTQLCEPVGRRTFDSGVKRGYYQVNHEYIYEVDTCLGCCTMFSTEDALAVGGWDKGFAPVWIEDDDFGMSIRYKLNKKVFYFPEVSVCHRISMRNSRNPNQVKKTLSERVLRKWRKIAYAIQGRTPIETNAWRSSILKNHYAYWQRKWGFDPLNPDMDKVLQQYKHTGVVWRHDETMRGESDEIVRNYYEGFRRLYV